MALNTCEMRSIGIEKAFFPKNYKLQKVTKNRPGAGGSSPDHLKLTFSNFLKLKLTVIRLG